MKAIGTTVLWLLGAAFSVALVAAAMAGETDSAAVMPYEGQIRSIQIDKCGLEPGSCQGSIILAQAGGAREVRLAVTPGTWLKRGDRLVTIDELGVGNDVKVKTVRIPHQPLQEITPLSAGKSS
jgi:hypothetical protein